MGERWMHHHASGGGRTDRRRDGATDSCAQSRPRRRAVRRGRQCRHRRSPTRSVGHPRKGSQQKETAPIATRRTNGIGGMPRPAPFMAIPVHHSSFAPVPDDCQAAAHDRAAHGGRCRPAGASGPDPCGRLDDVRRRRDGRYAEPLGRGPPRRLSARTNTGVAGGAPGPSSHLPPHLPQQHSPLPAWTNSQTRPQPRP